MAIFYPDKLNVLADGSFGLWSYLDEGAPLDEVLSGAFFVQANDYGKKLKRFDEIRVICGGYRVQLMVNSVVATSDHPRGKVGTMAVSEAYPLDGSGAVPKNKGGRPSNAEIEARRLAEQAAAA
jgi:hypothetical protein